MYGKHLQSENQIDKFIRDPSFISLYRYHFSSTRVTSIIVEVSNTDNWKYFTNELIHEIQKTLGIPTDIWNMICYSQNNWNHSVVIIPNRSPPILQQPPDYINDYPAESQHSYILLIQYATNLYNYVAQGKNNIQQKDWNPKDNFLIIVAMMSVYNCYSVSLSYTAVRILWTNSWILNVVTFLKFFAVSWELSKSQTELLFIAFSVTIELSNS